MLARKCDRCGKAYKIYQGNEAFNKSVISNGIMFVDRLPDNSHYSRDTIDLCQECMQKLVDWLEEGKHCS